MLAAGCHNRQAVHELQPGWERMQVQPRYNPYKPSTFFSDGRAMRTPPAGTVPRGQIVGNPLRTLGQAQGNYATSIPVPVTAALLNSGREHFENTCAVCHGVLGDGHSQVALNMFLRPPPSLHEARIRNDPPGRLYEIVRQGYGLMPSYAALLTVDERWAVVAYVRALQLSQGAPVATLPAHVQAQLMREAP
jgi:mono/diheme cytochrome c family protein